MDRIKIIKIGGNVIDSVDALAIFLKKFSQVEGKKILVHGGGKMATQTAEKLGMKATLVEGRRITDQAMLDVVTMVYAGLVNKKIVAELQALGCNAFGFTGVDGNLIGATKRPLKNNIDYGFVGDVEHIKIDLIVQLLNMGLVPVIAPITHNEKGLLLNTNADTIANEVAATLSSQHDVSLIYAFELNGVLEQINQPESVIRNITRNSFEKLKINNIIHSGMIPKLENALTAIDRGVKEVVICKNDQIDQLEDSSYNLFTRITA